MEELDPSTHRQRWLALAVLVFPVLIISLDATMLGFAVPHLSESLAPTSSQLLWIIDIYSFVLAGLLVTMGSLGDRIGRRRLLMIGAAGFSVVSVAAAFSPNAMVLILMRALLGVAGATLMPSTLSLIRNIFTDTKERQIAITVWSMSFAIGGTAGPILGGVLLDHFWWGSVFLIGVPVTVTMLIVAPKLLPESRDPAPGAFDIVSSVLSIVAMIPLVYAIKMWAEDGLGLDVYIPAVVGLGAGVLFVRRQRGLSDPMIDLSLFGFPGFRRAIVANMVSTFGFAGALFFITQHFQLVLGMSTLRAGMQLLPSVVFTIAFMGASPWLVRRYGPFPVVTLGLVLGAIGYALFALVGLDSSVLTLTAIITLSYAGLSMGMTVAVDAIMSDIPPERAGAGASVSETANELGMALGTALLGSVWAAVYRPRIDEITGIPSEVLDVAHETLGAAVGVAQQLPEADAYRLITSAQDAFVAGVRVASLVATGAILVVAVWTATASRAVRTPHITVTEPDD